jgi:hypothetical protein
MLEPQEEYMLAKRWREHGDRDAANKLVTSHLRLVAKIAMGYRGYGLPISEVISEGNVGLIYGCPRSCKGLVDGFGEYRGCGHLSGLTLATRPAPPALMVNPQAESQSRCASSKPRCAQRVCSARVRPDFAITR